MATKISYKNKNKQYDTTARAIGDVVDFILREEWFADPNKRIIQLLDHFGLERVPEVVYPTCEYCGGQGTPIIPEGPGSRLAGSEIHICPPVELEVGDIVSPVQTSAHRFVIFSRAQGYWNAKSESGLLCSWNNNSLVRRHNPGDPPFGRNCK